MIARYTNKGWTLITQRAHGIVAAQFGLQWSVKQRPERWLETVLAIAEHDDAENELDGENLLTPAHGPLNYDMKVFDLQHCQKLSSLTITKSRYIALLTSMHMEFLYGRGKSVTAEGAKFLANERRMRKKWMTQLKLTAGEANRIYDLVEWCDAISLLICTEVIQEEGRQVEISTGPDGTSYHLKKLNEHTLTVVPWPFETNSFELRYDFRTLLSVEFSNSKQLREEFLKAKVEEKVWLLEKSRAIKLPKKKNSATG